jgi:GNAT superfamily N-acetyltransferase
MRDPDAIVRPVKPQEVDAAAGVLANAFSDDPIFRFILGDRDDMEIRLGHLFRDAAEAELRKSAHLVEIVDSGNAVALWHEVDDWKTSPTALLRSVPSVVKAFGSRLPRALQVLASAEKVHPAEPHRHLMYIGTHKDHNGKGLGSALLGSMLERCDDDGVPTYLESTNPANDAWYARFGFESRGPVPLPKGAPVLTAMWRKARWLRVDA